MAIEVDPLESVGIRFIRTPDYYWFEEFAEACAQYRYIGVCHGPAGVGKTWAARYFSQWESTTKYVADSCMGNPYPTPQPLPRALYYTASVTNTPRQLRDELALEFDLYFHCNRLSTHFSEGQLSPTPPLLLVDEADRLAVNSLEYIRDLYDLRGFGLILIGMSGLEKRLKRYAQLYSRVGFSHAYRALALEDLKVLLTKPLDNGKYAFDHLPFSNEEAVGRLLRSSRGNLRLVVRLLSQIDRLTALNELDQITPDVVTAATRLLTIGPID